MAALNTLGTVAQGNSASWDAATRAFVDKCKSGPKPYSLRYVGSMVADVHRTLLYGGVFMYPADKKVWHIRAIHAPEHCATAFGLIRGPSR